MIAPMEIGPVPSMTPANSRCGPMAGSLCGRVHRARADEVELVADIADAGDTGCQVNGAPFHLLVMSMHVPEPGQREICRRRREWSRPWEC